MTIMQKLEGILAEADKMERLLEEKSEELLQGGIFEDEKDLTEYDDLIDLQESESYSNLR